MPSDGIDFVDEDNTGSVLLSLHEEVANSRRPHANEHLDEVRTGNREEWNPGFACDRPRKQRLTGAWRSDQQNPLGHSAAPTDESFRIAQELDYLFEFILGFIDSSDVSEGDFMRILCKQLGAALPEGHRLAAAYLHLPHEEY